MENNQKQKDIKFLESIFDLEEFFSIEDYSTYLMAKTGLNTISNSSKIRLLFPNDNIKSIEEIVFKNNIIKIFDHIKIYEPKKQYFINILVKREGKSEYDGNKILKKINEKIFLKPIIKTQLKINKFPLINYSLEQTNNEGDIIVFILKENKTNNPNRDFYNKEDTLNVVNNYITNDLKNKGQNGKNKVNNIQNTNINNISSPNLQNNDNNIYMNQNNPNMNPMNNNNNNMNLNPNMNIGNVQMNNNNMYIMKFSNQNNVLMNNNNMNLGNSNKNQFNNNNSNSNIINNNINAQNNNGIINQKKEDKIKISSVCCPEGYEKEFSEIGLNNVGLTCYMNSTLQLLLHIPELNSFFVNKYPSQKYDLEKINKDADTRGRLSEEYCELVNKMMEKKNNKNPTHHSNHYYYNYNNYNSISPKNFNDLLSRVNPQFAKFESNDSKDLLLYLIQSMHAELNYKGAQKLSVPKCNQTIELDSFNFFMKVNSELNLSIFSYLFYGIIKSSTTCFGCKNVLYNYQYFQFLSFPTFDYVRKKFNIYRGLKDYIKVETMKGDNQCYCQKCRGLRDAYVNSILFYTPPYLLINFDYGKNKKFSPSKVEFGEYIDLTGFTEVNCTEKTYSLIGISTHIGASGNSGHYIAYCKDVNKKQWYKFNDSIVSKCSYDEVNSNTPYLLVFKKGSHDLLY